jgi:hypothetical protein
MPPPATLGAVRSKTAATMKQLDWLWLFLASWVLPLGVAIVTPLTYWSSLLFWLVPTLLLLPRFLAYTDAGGRRRTALLVSAGNIVLLGLVLDFVLGAWVLRFDNASPDAYLFWIRVSSLRIEIPIEEVFFYAMSPVAILLVYAWADEYWVEAYSARKARLAIRRGDSLVRFSPTSLGLGLAMIVLGIVLHRRLQPGAGLVPTYFTFLVAMGLGPAVMLYPVVSRLVNWRAFGVTTLYLLITSIIWEGGLAIPRHWWGYQTQAMIGVWVDPWTIDPLWPLPIEAVLVWLAAPFSCVLLYEAVRFVYYRRQPDKPTFVHPDVVAAHREQQADAAVPGVTPA